MMATLPLDFLGFDFWAAENRRLLAVLLPLIQEGAELGVEIAEGDLWDEFQIGFDNALANEAAASWARQYTDNLLEMLGTTTQRVVGAQIANYIETPGMTQGDLAAALEKVLGTNRQRALMIGRTESTRATAAGRDEGRVAAGLPATLFKPPLHPRGRCGDAAELLDDGTWVVTWQTRRDEVVCTAEYDVPWGTGTVRGCRGMHGRVISEGPYFGMLVEDARVLAAERAEEQVTAEQASAELAGALTGYEAWQAGRRSVPVKFDPRQPRDEAGRWMATGAAGEGILPLQAPSLRGSGSESDVLHKVLSSALPVPEDFDEEEVEEMDWDDAEIEVCAEVKSGIVSQLSSTTGISESDVNSFVHQWAKTSNGHDMRSLAIQRDAAKEFGVELSEWQNKLIALNEKFMERWSADTPIPSTRAPLLPSDQQQSLLRAMYNQTQSRLLEAGLKPGDTVRLYRGLEFDKLPDWSNGEVLSFDGNALESWSIGQDAAAKFAGIGQTILVADVPIGNILSTARSGFGCLNEGEVVVFGSIPDSEVLAWIEEDYGENE